MHSLWSQQSDLSETLDDGLFEFISVCILWIMNYFVSIILLPLYPLLETRFLNDDYLHKYLNYYVTNSDQRTTWDFFYVMSGFVFRLRIFF